MEMMSLFTCAAARAGASASANAATQSAAAIETTPRRVKILVDWFFMFVMLLSLRFAFRFSPVCWL
jgi:hypothetical protein